MDTTNRNPSSTLKLGGTRGKLKEVDAKATNDRFLKEIEAVGGASHIDTVDLSCRCIPESCLKLLRPSLDQVAPFIKNLWIADVIASLPTEQGLATLGMLADIFKVSPLVQLDLQDNALGSRGDVVLIPLFSLPTLQQLSLENCGMSVEVTESLLGSLHLPDDGVRQFTHFYMGRNQMGDKGAPFVGTLLGQCPHLVAVHYNGSRPLSKGTFALLQNWCRGIQDQTSLPLVELDLNDCSIGSPEKDEMAPDMWKNFMSLLERSPGLTKLVLQDNEIEPTGLEKVLSCLQTTQAKLTSLALGGCELEEEGPQVIVDALKQNENLLSNLEKLTLDTNGLSDDSLVELIPLLAQHCPMLRELDLEANDLGPETVAALCANPLSSLKVLNLDNNEDMDAELGSQIKAVYPWARVQGDEEDEAKPKPDAAVDALADQLAAQL